jgi:hypothetical protein
MSSRLRIVIALYFALLFICIGLWILSTQFGMTAQEQLSEVASSGIKTVLGALIGVLSVVAGADREKAK